MMKLNRATLGLISLVCAFCVSADPSQQTSLQRGPSNPTAPKKTRYDHELRVNGLKVFPEPTDYLNLLSGDGPPRRPDPGLLPGPDAYFGLRTFSRSGVPPVRCLTQDNETLFDIAIVGIPFDTATSYRPGARFGPNGIRAGSQLIGGYNRVLGVDPFAELSTVDCGDIPVSQFSNPIALYQIEAGMSELLSRRTKSDFAPTNITKTGVVPPRILTLGGDHTITLPILRSLEPVYGPVTVIHFDSHLDTWAGDDPITHGNYFYIAWKEKLMSPDRNIHVGIKDGMWNRTHHNDDGDDMVGFSRVYGEDIDHVGIAGVIKMIRDRVGDDPVYITFDVDCVDPFAAPGTGTPSSGGYTPREVLRIIQGLAGLRVIGADVVEVAPAYDTVGEITQILAANIGWQFLSLMAMTPL